MFTRVYDALQALCSADTTYDQEPRRPRATQPRRKRRRTERHVTPCDATLLGLPPELLAHILASVPVEDWCAVLCSSRRLHDAGKSAFCVSDALLRRTLLQHTEHIRDTLRGLLAHRNLSAHAVLCHACECEHGIAWVRACLALPHDADAALDATAHHNEALYCATRAAQRDSVSLLLEQAGASCTDCEREQYADCALACAVSRLDEQTVALLLRGYMPRSAHDQHALHHTVHALLQRTVRMEQLLAEETLEAQHDDEQDAAAAEPPTYVLAGLQALDAAAEHEPQEQEQEQDTNLYKEWLARLRTRIAHAHHLLLFLIEQSGIDVQHGGDDALPLALLRHHKWTLLDAALARIAHRDTPLLLALPASMHHSRSMRALARYEFVYVRWSALLE